MPSVIPWHREEDRLLLDVGLAIHQPQEATQTELWLSCCMKQSTAKALNSSGAASYSQLETGTAFELACGFWIYREFLCLT